MEDSIGTSLHTPSYWISGTPKRPNKGEVKGKEKRVGRVAMCWVSHCYFVRAYRKAGFFVG